MARGTSADMTVLALVGERGREVGEFLEVIGDEGRKRCVVVVSTSDQSPCCDCVVHFRLRPLQSISPTQERMCFWSSIPLPDLQWHNAKSVCRPANHRRRRAIRPQCLICWLDWLSGQAASRMEYYCLLHCSDGGRRSTGPCRRHSAIIA